MEQCFATVFETDRLRTRLDDTVDCESTFIISDLSSVTIDEKLVPRDLLLSCGFYDFVKQTLLRFAVTVWVFFSNCDVVRRYNYPTDTQ